MSPYSPKPPGGRSGAVSTYARWCSPTARFLVALLRARARSTISSIRECPVSGGRGCAGIALAGAVFVEDHGAHPRCPHRTRQVSPMPRPKRQRREVVRADVGWVPTVGPTPTSAGRDAPPQNRTVKAESTVVATPFKTERAPLLQLFHFHKAIRRELESLAEQLHAVSDAAPLSLEDVDELMERLVRLRMRRAQRAGHLRVPRVERLPQADRAAGVAGAVVARWCGGDGARPIRGAMLARRGALAGRGGNDDALFLRSALPEPGRAGPSICEDRLLHAAGGAVVAGVAGVARPQHRPGASAVFGFVGAVRVCGGLFSHRRAGGARHAARELSTPGHAGAAPECGRRGASAPADGDSAHSPRAAQGAGRAAARGHRSRPARRSATAGAGDARGGSVAPRRAAGGAVGPAATADGAVSGAVARAGRPFGTAHGHGGVAPVPHSGAVLRIRRADAVSDGVGEPRYPRRSRLARVGAAHSGNRCECRCGGGGCALLRTGGGDHAGAQGDPHRPAGAHPRGAAPGRRVAESAARGHVAGAVRFPAAHGDRPFRRRRPGGAAGARRAGARVRGARAVVHRPAVRGHAPGDAVAHPAHPQPGDGAARGPDAPSGTGGGGAVAAAGEAFRACGTDADCRRRVRPDSRGAHPRVAALDLDVLVGKRGADAGSEAGGAGGKQPREPTPADADEVVSKAAAAAEKYIRQAMGDVEHAVRAIARDHLLSDREKSLLMQNVMILQWKRKRAGGDRGGVAGSADDDVGRGVAGGDSGAVSTSTAAGGPVATTSGSSSRYPGVERTYRQTPQGRILGCQHYARTARPRHGPLRRRAHSVYAVPHRAGAGGVVRPVRRALCPLRVSGVQAVRRCARSAHLPLRLLQRVSGGSGPRYRLYPLHALQCVHVHQVREEPSLHRAPHGVGLSGVRRVPVHLHHAGQVPALRPPDARLVLQALRRHRLSLSDLQKVACGHVGVL
eukprot:ctg_167.g105